jgi:hypothetical protein
MEGPMGVGQSSGGPDGQQLGGRTKEQLKETGVEDVATVAKRLMEGMDGDLKSKIEAYIKKNPTSPDDVVKKMALMFKVDEMEVEDALYQIAVSKLAPKKNIKEAIVQGSTLPAQDIKATISGGKAKVNSVTPSKANGMVKTATVIDTSN